MSMAISKGLKQKHGDDYKVRDELQKLKQNYIDKLKESDAELQRLSYILQKTESYHQMLAIEKLMQPYFQMWLDADSGVGKENIKTGQSF